MALTFSGLSIQGLQSIDLVRKHIVCSEFVSINRERLHFYGKIVSDYF